MRYSNIIFLCLLATVFCFGFQFIALSSTSAASLVLIPGRRSMRTLISLSPPQQDLNKVNVDAKKPTKQDCSVAKEYEKNSNEAELVYSIDYNGVMTHPTPTPKHP